MINPFLGISGRLLLKTQCNLSAINHLYFCPQANVQTFQIQIFKSRTSENKNWSPRYICLHPSIPRHIKNFCQFVFWSVPWSQSLEWNLCPTWKIYSRRWDLLSPSPSSPSFLSSVSQSRRFSFHFLFCRIASVEAVSFISIISGTFLVSLPFFRAPMDRLARIAVGSNISNYIPVRRVESLVGHLVFFIFSQTTLTHSLHSCTSISAKEGVFSYSLWLVREKRSFSRKKKNLLQSATIESFSLSHRLLAGVG